ncbi:MAG: ABC transporter substrate-binding protein [Desulfobacterota bacterium]|jgi:branched-chain amino acid transport system substrate-binding protein|nr:ABC transporter substrate-binding protein [Thermodesulfobacteriota bacterium]
MKRMIVVFLSLFMATVIFLPGSSTAQQKAPYILGGTLDLTGRQSNLGIGGKRGMDIAVETINAGGGVNGRPLKVIYYDTESEPAKAVIHTKRLVEVDKAVLLGGYSSSGAAMAVLQTVESAKTPMIAATPIDKLWIPTKKWVFNVVPRQREASIPVLLENLIQRGAKKIAYLYIDTAYGQAGKEVFDWAVKELKITPAVVEKYAPGSTDMSPQITHLKAAGVDGLLITGNVPDTVVVIKNARDQGFNHPIVSDYAIVGPEFIDLAGKYAEGIVSTSLKTLIAPDLPASDVQKKVAMDLYTKYTKAHGAFSLYAGHPWDQVYLVAEALKKVDPKLDPAKDQDLIKIREQLRDNLEKIKGFVGQNGVFNYSPENHNGLGPKCYVPVVIEKGTWKLYKGK